MTGPLEVRDFGPMGRRLGTAADCYDGSPWELHRGELVEQMGSKDIHGITMALIAALFRTHARGGLTVMNDVYCNLDDSEGPSLRAPDVVLVRDLMNPRNEVYRGTPVLAAEVRGTQSKRYLEEKVQLYLEHDWPCIWIAHAERREVEVLRRGIASVTYRLGTEVPLPPELDKHGLTAVPVAAVYDGDEASRSTDGWVCARGRAEAVVQVLSARRLVVPVEVLTRVAACTDIAVLDRWLTVAATCATAETFAASVAR